MVLGVVMISAMLPTMIGLNEATKASRDQEESRRNDARKQRSQLVATCSLDQGTPEQRQQVHNAQIQVGRDGKVSSVMQREGGSAEAILTNGFPRSYISPRNPVPRWRLSMGASTRIRTFHRIIPRGS